MTTWSPCSPPPSVRAAPLSPRRSPPPKPTARPLRPAEAADPAHKASLVEAVALALVRKLDDGTLAEAPAKKSAPPRPRAV